MRRCGFCAERVGDNPEEFAGEEYCGAKCRDAACLAAAREHVSAATIRKRVKEVHLGDCPRCGRKGPNDVQTHYLIWSVVLITSKRDVSEICCRTCGIKKRLGGLLYSGTLGWWGIPVGILLTPVQVVRNAFSLFAMPRKGKPSPKLEEAVRIELGAAALEERRPTMLRETPVATSETVRVRSPNPFLVKNDA